MNSGIVMEILQSIGLSEIGPKCNISSMANVCFSFNFRSYRIEGFLLSYLSTTIAANFQSPINSASSSALRIRAVINCNSLRIRWRSLWLQPMAVWCSSTVVGRPKLLQISIYIWIMNIWILRAELTPTSQWRFGSQILCAESRRRCRGHWPAGIWRSAPLAPAPSCDCLIVLFCV